MCWSPYWTHLHAVYLSMSQQCTDSALWVGWTLNFTCMHKDGSRTVSRRHLGNKNIVNIIFIHFPKTFNNCIHNVILVSVFFFLKCKADHTTRPYCTNHLTGMAPSKKKLTGCRARSKWMNNHWRLFWCDITWCHKI